MLKKIVLASTVALFAISASHAAPHKTTPKAPAAEEKCHTPEEFSKALEGRGFKVTNDLTGDLFAAFKGRVAKEMPGNPLPDTVARIVILHKDGNASLVITVDKNNCGIGVAVLSDSALAKLLDDGSL